MPVTLPPLLLDKLDAVNILLQSIGEAPVNTIEVPESVDVSAALQTLDEISEAVQSEGWSWNREYGFTLTPDSTGQLLLPSNCLRMVKAYEEGYQHPKRATQRGSRVYNNDAWSFAWDTPLLVDMILLLPFAELPSAARRYITIRAAKQFQGRLQTSATVSRILEEEVMAALAAVHHAEDEADTHNAINGNSEVSGRIRGRGVRRTGF